MNFRILASAEQELWDAASYYETERSGLGLEFLNEFLRGSGRINEMPTAWPKLSTRSRRYRLRKFPYGIVYQLRETEILVIAVMHLHRRPDYWRDRER